MKQEEQTLIQIKKEMETEIKAKQWTIASLKRQIKLVNKRLAKIRKNEAIHNNQTVPQ